MDTPASNAAPEPRAAYRIDEVARISGLGRSTVYEEIGAGRLVARKVGKRTVILAADLDGWLSGLPKMEAANASAA